MSQADYILWIWRELRVSLPAEWEMLQYGREREGGNAAFADRYQYRFELDWKEVEGEPDFGHMMRDYRAKLRDEEGYKDLRDLRHGPWHGIEGRGKVGANARFGRYFEALKRLVEVVFLWPDYSNEATHRKVLDSIRPELETAKGLQRWRCFGLDLHATATLELEESNIRPALASLTFGDSGKGDRLEHFERLGMVDHWLTGSLSDWLEGKQPPKLVDVTRNRREVGRHSVELRDGHGMAMRFPTVGKRTNRYSSAAWRCPGDGRLYHASVIQPAADPAVNLIDGGRLRCCADFGDKQKGGACA